MSIKSKVFAAATTLTVLGGVGATGVLTSGAAHAATPSCGNFCVNLFNRTFGHHSDPSFVLDVWRQAERSGQPIILYRQSQQDPAEDFTVDYDGTVADFYEAGLVSSALALHYGGGCQTLGNCGTNNQTAYPNDYAFELEYSPYGVESGLCAGVATIAGNKTPISLQPCGATARTVWVVDEANSTRRNLVNAYVPLINGSDTNFSHPYVLTYPANGYPTDIPRPQLFTQTLTGFSQGGNPFNTPTSVNTNQLWGGDFGVLR